MKFKIFLILLLFVVIFTLKDNSKFQNNKNNKNNNKTELEVCDVEINIKKGFLTASLPGRIYKKENKIRIFGYTKDKKEIDIGLNDNYFWYYSYKEDPDTLFFCNKKLMAKSMKPQFNPEWFINIILNKYEKSTEKEFYFEYIFQNNTLLKSNLIYKDKILSKVFFKNNIIYFETDSLLIYIKYKNITQDLIEDDIFTIPTGYLLNEMIIFQETF